VVDVAQLEGVVVSGVVVCFQFVDECLDDGEWLECGRDRSDFDGQIRDVAVVAVCG